MINNNNIFTHVFTTTFLTMQPHSHNLIKPIPLKAKSVNANQIPSPPTASPPRKESDDLEASDAKENFSRVLKKRKRKSERDL